MPNCEAQVRPRPMGQSGWELMVIMQELGSDPQNTGCFIVHTLFAVLRTRLQFSNTAMQGVRLGRKRPLTWWSLNRQTSVYFVPHPETIVAPLLF